MGFLIDEDLPRSVGDLLRSHGHEATDIRDIGLRGAKDHQIAAYARDKKLIKINTFNLKSRYPDEKRLFRKKCTEAFTINELKQIEEVFQWLKLMLRQ